MIICGLGFVQGFDIGLKILGIVSWEWIFVFIPLFIVIGLLFLRFLTDIIISILFKVLSKQID